MNIVMNKNRNLLKRTFATIALVLGMVFVPAGAVFAQANTVQTTPTSFSQEAQCANGNTNCIPKQADPASQSSNLDCDGDGNPDVGCNFYKKYLNAFIKLLSALTGLAVIIGIIYGGILYASSAGDPQQVAHGKQIIINSIIALFCFFLLYAFVRFLIPGVDITG